MKTLQTMLLVVSLAVFGSIASAQAMGSSALGTPEATAITLFVCWFLVMVGAGWVKRRRDRVR